MHDYCTTATTADALKRLAVLHYINTCVIVTFLKKKIRVGENALDEVFSLQLLGYTPILVYHCAALCKMYCFYHILSSGGFPGPI